MTDSQAVAHESWLVKCSLPLRDLAVSNLHVHSLAFTVQSSSPRVHGPESSIQSPTFRVQRPESRVHPEILACQSNVYFPNVKLIKNKIMEKIKVEMTNYNQIYVKFMTASKKHGPLSAGSEITIMTGIILCEIFQINE